MSIKKGPGRLSPGFITLDHICFPAVEPYHPSVSCRCHFRRVRGTTCTCAPCFPLLIQACIPRSCICHGSLPAASSGSRRCHHTSDSCADPASCSPRLVCSVFVPIIQYPFSSAFFKCLDKVDRPNSPL